MDAGAAVDRSMPPLHRQVRWWILALLFCVTIINFVDRQALSLVAPILRDELKLSNAAYGQILSAFFLGMTLAEFPMGWAADRFGPRRTLGFAVLSWSLAQAAHALASTALHLKLARFWLATGECANYSSGAKVVSQWFPVRERSFAFGVFNGAGTIGNIIAPLTIPLIAAAWGWRMAFLLPSLLGFVWLVFWWRVYRAPSEHPKLTPAEARHIGVGGPSSDVHERPDAALLAYRAVWGLMLCRFLVGPVVQFYLAWIPEYLYRVRGVPLKSFAAFLWIPFVFADLGSVSGGASGWLIRRGYTVRAARTAALLFGAVLCFASVVVPMAPSLTTAVAAICVVLFGHYFLSANMFAAVTDIVPPGAVARATALTGIAGGISGFIFPTFAGRMIDAVSYAPVFVVAAFMPLAGVLVLLVLGRGFRRIGA